MELFKFHILLVLAMKASIVLSIPFGFGTDHQIDCYDFYDARCLSGQCLHSNDICNLFIDCYDQSDEDKDMCAKRTCKTNQYRCDSGQCIPENRVCDGRNDCYDHSDENQNMCASIICKDKFLCKSGGGQCVDNNLVCNGSPDCKDGSDEDKCDRNKCNGDSFRCHSGECIASSLFCNGVKDCKDGSDEDDTVSGVWCK